MVELLNTAIETVVDRISLELHPLSKRAKDLGGAAQLVARGDDYHYLGNGAAGAIGALVAQPASRLPWRYKRLSSLFCVLCHFSRRVGRYARDFDLNDLYAFRALVEYGNFRLAAESICLSQSALSRRIEKLENALGIKLFDHHPARDLDAVRAGLRRTFGAVTDERRSGDADIDKVSQERVGLVTVATVPSAAYYFMPDVIRRFRLRYPRVRVTLIDGSAGNVIEAVTGGQADFGICFAGRLQPNLEFVPLVGDVYVAACRRDHPLAGKRASPGGSFISRITCRWIKPPAIAICSISAWNTSCRNAPACVKLAM